MKDQRSATSASGLQARAGKAPPPPGIQTIRCPGATACRRGTAGGFTLLELIVVILLLTILLGFAIPAFQAGGAAGSKDRVARELLHAVKKLKIAALNRQSIHRLHLDLDENRIWVSRNDRNSDPAPPGQFERILPDDIRIEHVRFAGREEIRSGVAVIAFYPQGHSDRAVIRLTDGRSKPIDLVVEAFLPMALIVSDNDTTAF
jgi:prepilin-type N-terminal cleavage/methylation domain-containing protein